MFPPRRFTYTRAFGGTARLYRANVAGTQATTAGVPVQPRESLGLDWAAPDTGPGKFGFVRETSGARTLQRADSGGAPVSLPAPNTRMPLPPLQADGEASSLQYGALTYSSALSVVTTPESPPV